MRVGWVAMTLYSWVPIPVALITSVWELAAASGTSTLVMVKADTKIAVVSRLFSNCLPLQIPGPQLAINLVPGSKRVASYVVMELFIIGVHMWTCSLMKWQC